MAEEIYQLFSRQSRVTQPRLSEPFRPQLAAVAMTTRYPFGRRVVTTMGLSIIDAQLIPQLDNLGFGQLDQRSMDLKPRPLDACLGGQVCQLFKRCDELRAAVGISAVVDGVNPQEEIVCPQHFGPAQRHRQEDRVACGDVSDRDARRHLGLSPILGDLDFRGQRRSAEHPQVELT